MPPTSRCVHGPEVLFREYVSHLSGVFRQSFARESESESESERERESESESESQSERAREGGREGGRGRRPVLFSWRRPGSRWVLLNQTGLIERTDLGSR